MTNCKVRFAPSPTGLMHIGNARVAIINYLFCRQNKGKFLFRIDDTDLQRSKKEYETAIKQDLEWLKITYDETFRQSERLQRYKEILEKLYEKGLVYKCYETTEELEFKRKRAILKGVPPVYDRAALLLTEADHKELEGKPFYWRFKLPNEIVSWLDLVLGAISYNLKNISDPVIAKSDGTFLYSFCSVIDDLDSGITHILRGQDHVTNTAAQIAMIEAISETKCCIEFAHFSLLINKDGSQFSKRLGSTNLGDIREQGVDAMAICDLLATLGTSKDTVPFTNMSELIEYFDIKSFSSNSPKFDMQQLFQLNKKVIRNRSFEEIKNLIGLEISYNAFEVIRENVENYNDFKKWQTILSKNYTIDSDKKIDVIKKINELLLNSMSNKINYLSSEMAQKILNEVSVTTNKHGKELYLPIQNAILGLSKGPQLVDVLTILSVEELIRRTSDT